METEKFIEAPIASEEQSEVNQSTLSDSITPAGLAEVALMPPTTNGMVTAMYTSKTMGANLSLQEMVLELNRQVMEAERNDRKKSEALLHSQAITLNAIFAEMARRAALNMNSNLPATEAFMRMALRAQNQSRSTLETFAAIKNPSLVVAKQANINTGPQQVNNVLVTPYAGESVISPNQLSGELHVLRKNS